MIIKTIDLNDSIIYKDEPNDKGVLGIEQNKIVEIPNFVEPETAANMIKYFEDQADQ